MRLRCRNRQTARDPLLLRIRYVWDVELLLKALPLRRDAPIYLPADAWPSFGNADAVAAVSGVDVIEPWEAQFAPA